MHFQCTCATLVSRWTISKLNWKLTFFLEVPHLGIMFSVFVARASVIMYKLARANIWIELNWIDAQRGVDATPLAFFPCNFLYDSNRKNRISVFVTRDERHILTYVTSSWRCNVTYVMTSYVHDGGQNTLFYHSLLIEISSDLDAIKWWGCCCFQ